MGFLTPGQPLGSLNFRRCRRSRREHRAPSPASFVQHTKGSHSSEDIIQRKGRGLSLPSQGLWTGPSTSETQETKTCGDSHARAPS